MMKKIWWVPASLLLLACNGGPNKTNIEIISNMMDQSPIKSQDWHPADGDKMQMRMPPKGAISREKVPYPYMNDPAKAETLRNPLAGNRSPEILTLGRKYYDIYCAVCHGGQGTNDGTVTSYLALPPRILKTGEAVNYSDGRIYHAIVAGRGVMRSYGTQIKDEKTRWAIVNYIRSLQGK